MNDATTQIQWRELGRRDRLAGKEALSTNPDYLAGYQAQERLENYGY
jgi:hypothetical protein